MALEVGPSDRTRSVDDGGAHEDGNSQDENTLEFEIKDIEHDEAVRHDEVDDEGLPVDDAGREESVKHTPQAELMEVKCEIERWKDLMQVILVFIALLLSAIIGLLATVIQSFPSSTSNNNAPAQKNPDLRLSLLITLFAIMALSGALMTEVCDRRPQSVLDN
ncbi:hypothetical protein SISSUDRAFT_1064161 [Sistotremastrum suecicum HHB10207 ss-3]|uniref:Transmembrane protein n=1 Tax=Sistotremastrum suecicum HHB10207 ss-3 TaxID=1314776 RepID=A0A166AZ70_9AGAM|nr:hypothetical protein SISSUDRAFT_1064161 [Sistotremastrum suecicum HHB10207 ss-3]